jgi:hypothetical protein
VDLAAPDLEVDAVEGDDARERLADTDHPQRVVGARG